MPATTSALRSRPCTASRGRSSGCRPTDERAGRYVGLIVEGSSQIAELLERLALVARIERGAYEPALQRMDSFELAQAAVESVTVGDVAVSGTGAEVDVDPVQTERSLAAYFFTCALRHAGPIYPTRVRDLARQRIGAAMAQRAREEVGNRTFGRIGIHLDRAARAGDRASPARTSAAAALAELERVDRAPRRLIGTALDPRHECQTLEQRGHLPRAFDDQADIAAGPLVLGLQALDGAREPVHGRKGRAQVVARERHNLREETVGGHGSSGE